ENLGPVLGYSPTLAHVTQYAGDPSQVIAPWVTGLVEVLRVSTSVKRGSTTGRFVDSSTTPL
ncbi:MAG: hypothetical protein VW937_09435, partial [Actinomycetota bacterium]